MGHQSMWFSVIRFVKDLNINLLAVDFLWLDILLFSMPAKIFSKNVVAIVDLEVLACLSLGVV